MEKINIAFCTTVMRIEFLSCYTHLKSEARNFRKEKFGLQ